MLLAWMVMAALWGNLEYGMTEDEVSASLATSKVQLSESCTLRIDPRFENGRLVAVSLVAPSREIDLNSAEDRARVPCEAELNEVLRERFGRWLDTNTVAAAGQGSRWTNYLYLRDCVVARQRISFTAAMETSVVFARPEDGEYAVRDRQTGREEPLICSSNQPNEDP